MAEIEIDGVRKAFGAFVALESVGLRIADGEFLALLGPSGCGKTTLLRIIAGLETQTSGRVLIGGRDVSGLPPRKRGLAMVFQNYAVFPHMTVRENVGFGLRMAHAEPARIARQVDRTAALLHIEPYMDRYPAQLSGGQRQRVAVARALAIEPAVLLMDEPLSNLDALLRLEMRTELKSVLQEAGTTTVYVTHDQTEAMGLADRIAVLYAGRIVQIDRPAEIYRNPATMFVGGFVGSPPMNFLRLPVANGTARLGALTLTPPAGSGERAVLGIRAEDLETADANSGFAVEVRVAEPMGSHTLVTGMADGPADPRRRFLRPAAAARQHPARPPARGARHLDAGEQRRDDAGADVSDALIQRAQAILRGNDRGGYTVPTARLYPFQWNWDSAFVAMGFATFDEPRAWSEIGHLLKGQWEDGLIPQIVFHQPSDDYFPGPAVWGIRRTPPTSGITQPPVLATAVRHLLDRARDGALAEARAAAIYPALVRNHRWWRQARDPAATGLVATLHPWETGMDNSPAWDTALARVPVTTTTPIARRDTGHVDAAMRPRGEEYQRFIHLVDCFRAEDWNPARMYAASPFRMADVGTNALLLRAERDLRAMAQRFGTAAEAAEIDARATAMHAAMECLWDDVRGLYVARDLIADAPVAAGTSAGFLPLFARHPAPARQAALAATLTRWAGPVQFLVPSTDPADPRFEPVRYWRGPVWAIVNWMLADDLHWSGRPPLAARVLGDTRALIEQAGFSEYFDPATGAGAGGGDFSWTAAVYLMLVEQGA